MANPTKTVQEWLKLAREDFQTAKILLEQKNAVTFRTIGFLCQQATEKAIKGFLSHKKVKFAKTHDIKFLGELVTKIDPGLHELMDGAIGLTPYAVEFRYPESADKEITQEELDQALIVAANILKSMIDRIR